jgi:hypothetical protein
MGRWDWKEVGKPSPHDIIDHRNISLGVSTG